MGGRLFSIDIGKVKILGKLAVDNSQTVVDSRTASRGVPAILPLRINGPRNHLFWIAFMHRRHHIIPTFEDEGPIDGFDRVFSEVGLLAYRSPLGKGSYDVGNGSESKGALNMSRREEPAITFQDRREKFGPPPPWFHGLGAILTVIGLYMLFKSNMSDRSGSGFYWMFYGTIFFALGFLAFAT
jgi:hypothetical protein